MSEDSLMRSISCSSFSFKCYYFSLCLPRDHCSKLHLFSELRVSRKQSHRCLTTLPDSAWPSDEREADKAARMEWEAVLVLFQALCSFGSVQVSSHTQLFGQLVAGPLGGDVDCCSGLSGSSLAETTGFVTISSSYTCCKYES